METEVNTSIRAQWASEGMARKRGVMGVGGEQLLLAGYPEHALEHVGHQ